MTGFRIVGNANAVLVLLIATLSGVMISCQTAPPVEQKREELSRSQENTLSEELTRALVQKYGKMSEKAVEKKLADVSSKLIESAPDLKQTFSTPPQIIILNDSAAFSVPGLGNTLYISKGALQSFLYENEMAYVLSVSMSLMRDKVPLAQLEMLQKENMSQLQVIPTMPAATFGDFLRGGWFDPDGFFDFGASVYIKADTDGLKAPYAAKYDHNGARTIYKRWSEDVTASNLKSFWKILPDINERYENIKIEVGKLAPIRNAILKNKDFEEFRMKVMRYDSGKKSRQ